MKVDMAPYVCDVCKIRQEKNPAAWKVFIGLISEYQPPCRLIVCDWDNDMAAVDGAAHACGLEHSQVLLARWLDHQTFADR